MIWVQRVVAKIHSRNNAHHKIMCIRNHECEWLINALKIKNKATLVFKSIDNNIYRFQSILQLELCLSVQYTNA